MLQEPPATKVVASAGVGMATSARGEDPAYIVTADADGYGFSLTRFRAENVICLMVEDQTHCPAGKSELAAELRRDRLVVRVDPQVVAGLDIPTDYVVVFSAPDAVLAEMDSALTVICADVGTYSRHF
jgi:hypothetical protein